MCCLFVEECYTLFLPDLSQLKIMLQCRQDNFKSIVCIRAFMKKTLTTECFVILKMGLVNVVKTFKCDVPWDMLITGSTNLCHLYHTLFCNDRCIMFSTCSQLLETS